MSARAGCPPFALRITSALRGLWRAAQDVSGWIRIRIRVKINQSINHGTGMEWVSAATKEKKIPYHTSESLYPATTCNYQKEKKRIIFPFLIHSLFFSFSFFLSYLRHGIYLVYPGRREKTTRFSMQTAECRLQTASCGVIVIVIVISIAGKKGGSHERTREVM